MTRMIFVNIAVKKLDRAVAFFKRLGFEFNQQFTDENATCMIVNEHAFVMLLVEPRFKDFTKKPICNSATHTEAILAISAESREKVQELVKTALEAGGKPANDPVDYGFMYNASFHDPDDHLWEVVWMDPNAVKK
ncbi:MAG TPA: VOC family protein [Polyangiaceae bacterium]|nr:VOC family protein [Polyangiaceae bacterium]